MPDLAAVALQQKEIPGSSQHHHLGLSITIHIPPLDQAHVGLDGLCPVRPEIILQDVNDPISGQTRQDLGQTITVDIAGPQVHDWLPSFEVTVV